MYLSARGTHYKDVKQLTRIFYDPTDLGREYSQYNIDYVPTGATHEEESANHCFFSNLVMSELQLPKLPVYGGLEIRRERLKSLLKVGQKLDIIIQAISRGREGKEAALMLISQAIPCIMHLKNCVGEKIIILLLARAAEKRIGRTLSVVFLQSIQNVVNTRILGTETWPKQWKVPLNEKGDSITKVSFSNKKTCLFIDNIDVLIDFIFSSPEDIDMRNIWWMMMQDYRGAMAILWKWSEYSVNDLKEFQLKIDAFFAAYVERSGGAIEGVTNYINMLGGKHIHYYLEQHGNLCKYSQQG
jgi:hypothetical protein